MFHQLFWSFKEKKKLKIGSVATVQSKPIAKNLEKLWTCFKVKINKN